MKTLRDKISDLKDGEATTALQVTNTARNQIATMDAVMAIGAIGAMDAIGTVLASRSIRGLQQFRDNKMHEALGYSRFDDFLDNDPRSIMTYRKFHDRERVLENEGDEVFDLFSSIGVPISKRRLLKGGAVTIEGETVVIGDERIEKSDQRRLLLVLSDLAQKVSILEKKDQKNEKVIAKGKDDVENWKRRVDEAKLNAIPVDSPDHPFGQALLISLGTLTRLADSIRQMPANQRPAFRDNCLRQIAPCVAALYTAFDIEPGDEVEAIPGLSDDDLSSLMDQ